MASTHEINWTVGGVEVQGYPSNANFTTDAVKFHLSFEFAFQIVMTSISGSPRLTFEVSNDGINFTNYIDKVTYIDLSNIANHFIIDDAFPPMWLRLKYEANGNNGLITFIDIRKRGN